MMDKPTKLYLQITNTCHMDCKQCYTQCSRLRSSDELSDQEWRAFFDELDSEGITQVYIEGGEPLFRPGFLDLARYAAERMLVWFRTHGNLISDEVARGIKAAGVGRVAVDLFSPDPEEFDFLAGVENSYARTVDGVKYLVAHEVPVDLVCIINKLNVGRLNDVVQLAESLNVNRVGFFRLYPVGRARKSWSELAPQLSDVMSALADLRVPLGMRVMNSWHPFDGNCCWQNAGVTSTGRSIGCPYLREFVNYGNIREQSFLSTWDNDLYKFLRSQKVNDACGECTETQGSRGGCRSTAYAFRGDWSAQDPFCQHKNDGIIDLTVLPQHMIDLSREDEIQISTLPAVK
jgi:radical SAM protein with 4Fe4S-binding SPASM domain